MNRGNLFDNNIDYISSEGLADKTELFKRIRKYIIISTLLVETGQLSGFKSSYLNSEELLEDIDPKLGELLYSDQLPTN